MKQPSVAPLLQWQAGTNDTQMITVRSTSLEHMQRDANPHTHGQCKHGQCKHSSNATITLATHASAPTVVPPPPTPKQDNCTPLTLRSTCSAACAHGAPHHARPPGGPCPCNGWWGVEAEKKVRCKNGRERFYACGNFRVPLSRPPGCTLAPAPGTPRLPALQLSGSHMHCCCDERPQ